MSSYVVNVPISPLGVIIKTSTAMQPGIKRKLNGPELNQLSELHDYFAALDPKFPNRVTPLFQLDRYLNTSTLAGFHTTSAPIADLLDTRLGVKGVKAESGMTVYDLAALNTCTAAQQKATFASAPSVTLDQLSLGTIVKTRHQPQHLSHLEPDKIRKLLALKDRMGAAASGVTLYVVPHKSSYHLGGFSVESADAEKYLISHRVIAAPAAPWPAPRRGGSGYYQPPAPPPPQPPFVAGKCYGMDKLQLLLTQLPGTTGAVGGGVGVGGRG